MGADLNPGRWPGLRYFAPLGLKGLHGGTPISPFQGSGELTRLLNPGRWPGLRYFAPLGLNQRPSGDESQIHCPLWGSINGTLGLNLRPLGLKILADFSATSKHLDALSAYRGSER